MKNLVLLGEQRCRAEVGNDNGRHVVDVCRVFDDDVMDADEPAKIVLTNDGIILRLTEQGETSWRSDLKEMAPGSDGWFDVTYVDPALVCLSKSGAIVTVNPSNGETELIGDFEYGLEDAVWSPDREVLLMVTSATADDDDGNEPEKTKSVLLTMNSQFEVLAEVTIESFIPSSRGTEFNISATWRPDGSLCAISSVDEDDETRKVRIFKRETLENHAIGRAEDASGKLVKGLCETGFGWASAGCSQLLTSVQRKGKKTLQVVFFESNGLRHREFVLREDPGATVTSLDWNVDSDLLSVTLKDSNGLFKVQLWHRCNYHWYLKQEFRYPDQTVVSTKFDEEKPFNLYVILKNNEWREYIIRWDASSTLTSSDSCSAFAVDGCILNWTPLDRALVPPPMYMHNATMELPIHHVAFYPFERSRVSTVVVTSDSRLFLFLSCESDSFSPLDQTPIEVSLSNTHDFDLSGLRSWLVVGGSGSQVFLAAVLCAPVNENCEKLVAVTVTLNDNAKATGEITNTLTLEGRVLRMVNWSDSDSGALIEMDDGEMLEYDVDGGMGSLLPSDAAPLLEPCPWISALKEVGNLEDDGEPPQHSRLVMGISARSRLYCHDMLLSDAVSSFFVSMAHGFLCYVTAGSRCQIRFLPLLELSRFDPLMGSDQNEFLDGYEPRNVERGARLVGILPSQPSAVLQMPRGNMEGIFPRALVLRYAMTRISQDDFDTAFTMMRRQKVDLNVIVDMDPLHFLETGIEKFIDQVKSIDHLNLFISCLQDWDVTQGRFPVPSWLKHTKLSAPQQVVEEGTKVNRVCQKARKVMLSREADGSVPEGHFLLPVLSTFAKENPPQLTEALSLIRSNALKNHPQNSAKPPLFSDSAQSSIQYLAFLAEYELLFDTALGMYDYDLARAVARNSQMDPKVYLPLLKRLRALPESYSKFQVDMRLKRYENALNHLFASRAAGESMEEGTAEDVLEVNNSFDDCMQLINEQKLHSRGLELFRNEPEQRRTIFISLGDHLISDQQGKTALAVFMAADPPDFDKAKQAARAAGDWRTFFSLIDSQETTTLTSEPTETSDPAQDRKTVARDIARSMLDGTGAHEGSRRDKYSNAAQILLEYGDDIVGATDALNDGQLFAEAHRIACQHKRPELVRRCIDASVSYAQITIGGLEERTESFVKANKRYAEVIKIRKQASVEEGVDPMEEEADETGSLFSSASTASNMSLRSTRSTSSTSSTGSATSVSSVISVRSTTTFSMTGREETDRHRSKFNKGKRKKKPKKPKRSKIRPGSPEELQNLVATLKSECSTEEFAQTVAETCQFLIVVRRVDLARELFDGYDAFCKAVAASQLARIEKTLEEKAVALRHAREQGEGHEDAYLLTDLPIEKEVDSIACAPLPKSLLDFFAFP